MMMFKRFMSYFKPHKVMFTLDILAALTASLLSVAYPIITRRMLNDFIPNHNIRMVIYAGLIVLLIYLIRLALNYFIVFKGHMVGIAIQTKMRKDMFEHLQQMPFSYFDNQETGRIMSRLANDMQDISELAHHGPENVVICSVTMIVALTYLATINIKLSLIIFLVAPLLIWIAILFRNRHRQAFRMTKTAIGRINGNLENSISGIRVTKAFNNANKEIAKFDDGQVEYTTAYHHSYNTMAQFNSLTTFITEVFNVVVLIAGGLLMYNGEIDFADYSTFIVSINLFLNPIRTLINFVEQYQSGAAGFERFCELMDTPVEKDDEGAVDAGQLKGDISFINVSYGYDDSMEVLKDVSLDIHQGEKFALVGPSGGGKTTFCHLIPRFYELHEGCIEIDGNDIRHFTRESLRRNIGIVQQDVYLFNASIADNILYGRLDATDEEMIEAAKRAKIHDYIMTLPDGYDTQIGERGVRLSGGQKQRLAIARVFLKDPSILILDEATSALDNTTEVLIQQSLDELCIGRTTIVVAHRLSTIKNADRIAVINNGRLEQLGSHEELIKEKGLYKQLYDLQFDK